MTDWYTNFYTELLGAIKTATGITNADHIATTFQASRVNFLQKWPGGDMFILEVGAQVDDAEYNSFPGLVRCPITVGVFTDGGDGTANIQAYLNGKLYAIKQALDADNFTYFQTGGHYGQIDSSDNNRGQGVLVDAQMANVWCGTVTYLPGLLTGQLNV